MTKETELVELGACVIIAAGISRTNQVVEPQELWPHAVLFDQDNGITISHAIRQLNGEFGDNPMEVSSCAICGEAIAEASSQSLEQGHHISLEPMGGQADCLDELVNFGAYMCPTCAAKCPDDPIRLLVSRVLGDLPRLRYIKVE